MDIEQLKKTARMASRRNGTSHQSELNAIAVEHGHTHWGALLAASTMTGGSPSSGLPDGAYLDPAFDPPRMFLPIDATSRDGSRRLVAEGSSYAAAQWTGGMWAYAYGGKGEPDTAVQTGFEPTHYAVMTDADADKGTVRTSARGNWIRTLVERVEGLPYFEFHGRMLKGCLIHLEMAESRAQGRRYDVGSIGRIGMDRTPQDWIAEIAARASLVDMDTEAFDEIMRLSKAHPTEQTAIVAHMERFNGSARQRRGDASA
jgi:hypothetical protein